MFSALKFQNKIWKIELLWSFLVSGPPFLLSPSVLGHSIVTMDIDKDKLFCQWQTELDILMSVILSPEIHFSQMSVLKFC